MGPNRDHVFTDFDPPRDIPFTLGEYQNRLDRIRSRMVAEEIDLLWLSAPESLCYVSGYTCEWYQAQSPAEWPPTSGIAVRGDSDRFILFDTPSEALMCRFVTCADDIRIFPMGNSRDGIDFIVNELRAAGWLRGNVGMELHSYRPNPAVSGRFRDAFEAAGCRVVDGSDALREVRWLKSPAEIEYLEQAAAIADIGLAAARDTIAAGVTELEVYGEIVAAMSRAGGENPAITMPVLSGPKANTGHALSTTRVIEPGEQVNVDVCGVVHRYHANGARPFFVGEPPDDPNITPPQPSPCPG
jgi:Xaa-Pro aminopeptidase